MTSPLALQVLAQAAHLLSIQKQKMAAYLTLVISQALTLLPLTLKMLSTNRGALLLKVMLQLLQQENLAISQG